MVKSLNEGAEQIRRLLNKTFKPNTTVINLPSPHHSYHGSEELGEF